MRLAAEKAKKKTKANTAKTFGNAGYGKVRFEQSKNNLALKIYFQMCEKVSKYTETALLFPNQKKELLRLIRCPFYLRIGFRKKNS